MTTTTAKPNGLTRTGIEWADMSANPVRGKCPHACAYCYAEDIRRRFNHPKQITWHPEVLEAIRRRKKPASIFMGSAHDLFGNWVRQPWLNEVGETAESCRQHHFIFLTKNPSRYAHVRLMTENIYRGATVDTAERATAIRSHARNLDFLSIEPLLEDVAELIYMPTLTNIIIGAQSGEKPFVPPVEWVYRLIEDAKGLGVKVFIKDNLLALYPELPRLRELPWPLYTKEKMGQWS